MNRTKRIRSRATAGESLIETLIAMLISALALLVLSGSVRAASNMVAAGRDEMDAYYESSDTLSSHPEPETQTDKQNATLTFYLQKTGSSTANVPLTRDVEAGLSVYHYANTSQSSVISYALIPTPSASPSPSAAPADDEAAEPTL